MIYKFLLIVCWFNFFIAGQLVNELIQTIELPTEICLNACNNSPCLKEDKCQILGNQSYSCLCESMFDGTSKCVDKTFLNTSYMAIKEDEYCFSKNCLPATNCSDYEITELRCECKYGYYGKDCTSTLVLCNKFPCGDGNTCIDKFDRNMDPPVSYQCVCSAGFTQINQTYCKDINECENNPCQNGATCLDQINRAKCNCKQDYYGQFCEKNITPDVKDLFNGIEIDPKEIKRNLQFSISGGMKLRIKGKNLLALKCYGAFIQRSDQPTAINDSPKDLLYSYLEVNSSDNTTLNLIIPPVPTDKQIKYINKSMEVILDYDGFKFRYAAEFTYTPYPVITDIFPKDPFITGDVTLEIQGNFLDGLEPVMTYIVEASFKDKKNNGSIKTKDCAVKDTNVFVCPFEGFPNWDPEFYNQNNSDDIIFKIQIGFELGNSPLYILYNFEKTLPHVQDKLSLSLKDPKWPPFDSTIYYVRPHQTLKIKGTNFKSGASIYDYTVKVGSENCNVTKLLDTLMECLPPQEKPLLQPNEQYEHKDAFPVKVFLDKRNASSLVYLVKYPDSFPPLAILGIVAACLLCIIAIIIIYICCRRRNNELPPKKKDTSDGFVNTLSPNYLAPDKGASNETFSTNIEDEFEMKSTVYGSDYYANSHHSSNPYNVGGDGDVNFKSVDKRGKLSANKSSRYTFTRPQADEDYVN